MGRRNPTDEKWTLQGQPIAETRNYKYLGVVMEAMNTWGKWHDARVAKGKRCLPTMWWCGARQGALAHTIGRKLMEMMLWPAMAYGGELAKVGVKQAAEVETVQNAAARYILGTNRRTPIDVLRGELGWHSMETRRVQAQLNFFHRLQTMKPGRLAHDLFIDRFTSTIDRIARNEHRRKPLPIHGFCSRVLDSLHEYALLPHFAVTSTLSREQWGKQVSAAVAQHSETQWMESMEQRDSDSITLYRAMKTSWGEEPYLTLMDSPTGRRHMAQMRSSTAPLQALLHHQNLSDSPLCQHCELQQPEDQVHLLCVCPTYQPYRDELFESVRPEWERTMAVHWGSAHAYDRTVWLLSCPQVCNEVGKFLSVAFSVKRRLELPTRRADAPTRVLPDDE